MRKIKCEKCKMYHQGFHICLDLPERVMGQVEIKKQKQSTHKGGTLPPRSEEHREAHAAAMREIWAQRNGPRNKAMIERYQEGDIGYRALAAEFNVSHQTAFKVLKKAEAKGLIVMRTQGKSLRWAKTS